MEAFRYGREAFADELDAAPHNQQVGSRVLFENARIRVWDITLEPGERLPFHRHATSYFYRCEAGGTVQVRLPHGTGAVYASPTDEVYLHEIGPEDVVIHDLENVGKTTVRFTTVELLA